MTYITFSPAMMQFLWAVLYTLWFFICAYLVLEIINGKGN
jgi:hypothetical protein